VSRTLTRAIGGASIAAFFLAAFTPAVDLLGVLTTPDRPAERAEAIVVPGAGGVALGGGLTDSSLRATLEGITLFQQGWAPLLVLSGEASGPRRAEAEVRAEFARRLGVPAGSIVTLSTARTTREEALGIRALMQPRKIKKILLVVDGPGMIRAAEVFARVGFEVLPAPSSATVDLRRSPEARLSYLKEIGMELVARAYYRAMGYL
jgi:uncharacterized SAM-binding protein YcdF (DUF218 family)